MGYDEYQIPKGYDQTEIRAEIDGIQGTLAQNSVEKDKAPFQIIKDIENTVFEYRNKSLNELGRNAARRGSVGWLLGSLTTMPKRPTVSELVDKESCLGGDIFGNGAKFWLDVKPADTVFSNDVADWYYMQNASGNPNQPTVIRFQTTPYSIHKLYNGVEYAPSLDELKTFIKAVELYPDQIAPLYPTKVA